MGLFGSKPIYKYRILERYKADIEKENAEFRSSNNSDTNRYNLIGETDRYYVYYFQAGSSSSIHLLRQEKAKPKKVVYLGQAKRNMCVCNNKLFAIDRINHTSRTYHPLYCVDVETGERSEISVLSDKGCYIAMHWHCQDCVESITAKDDTITLEVTRYKEASHYEKEFTYKAYVKYVGGKFIKI